MSETLRDGEETMAFFQQSTEPVEGYETQHQDESLEDVWRMHSWERLQHGRARAHMGLYIIASQPDEFETLIGIDTEIADTMRPPEPYLKRAIGAWSKANRDNERRFHDFVVGATLDVLARTPDPVCTPLRMPPRFMVLYKHGWFSDAEWSELQTIYEGSQLTK